MDIVDRLRTIKDPPDYDSPLCFDAADEIERLRRDVDEANARAYVLAQELTLWQSRAALKEGSSDHTT